MQRLLDKSPKAEHYYSDAYSAYSEVCYYGTHMSLKNKSETYTVEGVNSDLRQCRTVGKIKKDKLKNE